MKRRSDRLDARPELEPRTLDSLVTARWRHAKMRWAMDEAFEDILAAKERTSDRCQSCGRFGRPRVDGDCDICYHVRVAQLEDI